MEGRRPHCRQQRSRHKHACAHGCRRIASGEQRDDEGMPAHASHQIDSESRQSRSIGIKEGQCIGRRMNEAQLEATREAMGRAANSDG